jgi:POT family proton-dependent oligopeptide transporter
MDQAATVYKYTRQNWLYLFSVMLEKAGYYGVRGLILIYMIRSPLALSPEKANTIYGLVIGCVVLFQVLGALLADFLVGNKTVIIIGGFLQALGTFILCIPSPAALYAGFVLFCLGGGLFAPNIIANYGKLFLRDKKIMDSGYTFFYAFIYLGAFLGTLLLTPIGTFNFTYGFIAGGIVMMLSVVLMLFRDDNLEVIHFERRTCNNNALAIFTGIVVCGIFWLFYSLGLNGQYIIARQLGGAAVNFPMNPTNLSTLLTMFGCGIMGFIWSFKYRSSIKKLVWSFLLAALGFGILFFLLEVPSQEATWFFLLSMLILSLAEIFISPIIYSVIAKNSNPRYLATMISISFIPISLVTYFINDFINVDENETPIMILIPILFLLSGLVLAGCIWLFNKRRVR